jgi:dTDP-4-dehydrorhamnose 3,5-epimerase
MITGGDFEEFMKIVPTDIDGLVVVENQVFEDSRGQFLEAYKELTFDQAHLPKAFVQDNISTSRKGVIRGLHYQVDPYAQGKLVRCFKGSIYDVAVDLRKGSKTYGRWHGVTLGRPDLALYVPPGFAHGFQSLEEGSLVYYKCTTPYSPAFEKGIRYDDSDLAIRWPIEAGPIVSAKDLKLPLFKEL